MATNAATTTTESWVKVGPKHYRHTDGAEVRFDPDARAWSWRVTYSDGTLGRHCRTLSVGKYLAEEDLRML
ncbi:MAG: hypothetical protein WKF51_14755 [Geodermatophilaceae bacterium]